jgi:hypothetical protein
MNSETPEVVTGGMHLGRSTPTAPKEAQNDDLEGISWQFAEWSSTTYL